MGQAKKKGSRAERVSAARRNSANLLRAVADSYPHLAGNRPPDGVEEIDLSRRDRDRSTVALGLAYIRAGRKDPDTPGS